jgi:hypothetical protein
VDKLPLTEADTSSDKIVCCESTIDCDADKLELASAEPEAIVEATADLLSATDLLVDSL